MYRKYAEYILGIVGAKKGNYLSFFPSYQFMEKVYEALSEEERQSINLIMQHINMKEEEREEFLDCFRQPSGENLVGFCVMGGIFAEGIDLTDDKLIGAIVVGTGLPQVCNEKEILKQYFDRRRMNGFDYSYLYPGVNKVLQAAGRVIRTESDKGVIALLDQRFMGRTYGEIFPREWEDRAHCNQVECIDRVSEFWKKVMP